MKTVDSRHIYLVITILCSLICQRIALVRATDVSRVSLEKDYYSPLFPPQNQLLEHSNHWNLSHNSSYGKLIPRVAWVAVRDAAAIPSNLLDMMKENPLWMWNICDNDCKDKFMNTAFAGTSVLWAYYIINPEVMIGKSEIWRLCVLWAYGGMYMDDDSYVGQKLDNVVEPTDKFLISPETGGSWKDQCYSNAFPFSNHSFNQRFGQANAVELWGNNYFLNWLIFSAPNNKVIERALERIVLLIKGEYMNKRYLLHRKNSHPGDVVFCATTAPLTLAARELVLENRTESLGLRIALSGFSEYGGKMKAWFSDYRPDHWVKVMLKKRPKYLRAYNSTYLDDIHEGKYEGKLIQATGNKQVFIIGNCSLRHVPDMNTFYSLGLDFSNVEVISPDELRRIRESDPVPVGSTSLGHSNCQTEQISNKINA